MADIPWETSNTKDQKYTYILTLSPRELALGLEEVEKSRFFEEEEEIPEHLIKEYIALRNQRREYLGYEIVSYGDIPYLKPS